MKRWWLLLLFIWALGLGCVTSQSAALFEGNRAFEHLKSQVALGPRPPGSQASLLTRQYLAKTLSSQGWQVNMQNFTADTPLGPRAMANVVATIAGTSSGSTTFLVGAHYDTKLFTDFAFVGANDGASGCAVLLELARVIAQQRLQHQVVLVFFDGEEALVHWDENDGLYGSRHYVQQAAASGLAQQLAAVFVVDMVGDQNLQVTYEQNSHPQLRELVFSQAQLGNYGSVFNRQNEFAVDDDHVPFLQAGIPALDIIGFRYDDQGLYPDYWHTKDDTLDKVSAQSLQAVGATLEQSLRHLDKTVASK